MLWENALRQEQLPKNPSDNKGCWDGTQPTSQEVFWGHSSSGGIGGGQKQQHNEVKRPDQWIVQIKEPVERLKTMSTSSARSVARSGCSGITGIVACFDVVEDELLQE